MALTMLRTTLLRTVRHLVLHLFHPSTLSIPKKRWERKNTHTYTHTLVHTFTHAHAYIPAHRQTDRQTHTDILNCSNWLTKSIFSFYLIWYIRLLHMLSYVSAISPSILFIEAKDPNKLFLIHCCDIFVFIQSYYIHTSLYPKLLVEFFLLLFSFFFFSCFFHN